MSRVITGLSLAAVLFFLPEADGHMAFKKELSNKYADMKITCNVCHVKTKPKTERNEFGKLFAKELKEKKLSDGFKARKGEERKKYETDVMVPAFKKALEKVKKLKPDDKKKTFDELIKAGAMPEITKKPAPRQTGED